MPHLRTSATDIDAFRRFREREDGDLEELLAQLRRELPPTPAMETGTALHTALENVTPGEFEALEANGYRFLIAPDVELALPDIREMKAEREYLIDGVEVTLVGKVDGVQGRAVTDHKFTSRFDPERFLGSFQWRIYLDVFDADEFLWNVFEGKEKNPGEYLITAVHPLRMHRYPGMGDDIERELRAFVDMARIHLTDKLEAA